MDNLLLRSATNDDLKAIHALAKGSGFGITTLPKAYDLLKARVNHSSYSWQHIHEPLHDAYYLLALEDPKTKQVIGTVAFEANTGADTPFYSYKISKRIKANPKYQDELLTLVNDHQGLSEFCTLYLDPAYRHEKCGAFLSRACFLLLAQHPSLFAPTVIAEMRGITDAKGNSPFWDALGHHFFHTSFAKADKKTLSTNKQFIADCMPEYPIYIKLLPKKAQNAIGKPHKSTVPAMHLLINEGFRYNRYVDIFDAGPMLETPLTQIETVKNSHVFILEKTQKNIKNHSFLISNTQCDFKSTKSPAKLNPSESTCILTEKTASLLQVKPGDAVRIAPF